MSTVQFGAQSVALPGVRTAVNSSQLGTVQVSGAANMALVGSANDGQPKVPVTVYNPAQLARVFASGPLVDAGIAAFAEGAPQITCVRPDPASQATLTLLDGSSAPSLVLTATSWGANGNAVQVQVAAGQTGGTVDFTVAYQPAGYTLTSTDLGQAFTLQYTGNGTGADLTIANQIAAPTQGSPATATTGGTIPASTSVYLKITAVNASGETVGSSEETISTGSGTATNTVTANWSAVSGATRYNIYASTTTGTETFQHQVTGEATASYILTAIATGGASVPTQNTTGKNLSTQFTGAPTDGSAVLDVPLNGANNTQYTTLGALVAFLAGQTGYVAAGLGNGQILTQYLDTVAAQSIATAYTATAKLGAIVNWINANAAYVTAAPAANAVNAPAVASLTNLAGGSNGTPAQSDWNAAIDALQNQDVQLVTPLTGTAATLTYCQADIKSWMQNGIAYMQGIYGLAWGATDAQLTQQAAALGTGDALLVGPGYVGPNSAGVATNFDGFYEAARVAGVIAGQSNAATPATNKTVHVSQLERNFSLAEQVSLLQGGVTCVVPRRKGGFKVLEDRTTNVASTNVYDTQGSVRRSVDLVRDHLQTNLDADVGIASLGVATQTALIQRATASLQADQSAGLIASFAPVTNVTQSTANGTVWLVDVDVSVEDPVNNVLATINLATGDVTTTAS